MKECLIQNLIIYLFLKVITLAEQSEILNFNQKLYGYTDQSPLTRSWKESPDGPRKFPNNVRTKGRTKIL